MAKAAFAFEITGFDKLAAVLRPELFQRLLKKHVGKATGQNGAYLAKMMRMTIRTQGAGPATTISGPTGTTSQSQLQIVGNRPLTIAIKKSSKPLVDNGDLFQGITHQRIDDFTAFAGVLRTSGRFKLAQSLHEGEKIPVTAQMRNMFMLLHRVTIGKVSPSQLTGRAAELWKRNQVWYPLKPTTNVIVIPGRPWVKLTLADPKVIEKMRSNWEYALAMVFADIRRDFYR